MPRQLQVRHDKVASVGARVVGTLEGAGVGVSVGDGDGLAVVGLGVGLGVGRGVVGLGVGMSLGAGEGGLVGQVKLASVSVQNEHGCEIHRYAA